MSRFEEGQEVNLALTGAGYTTREVYTILEIKKGKVWLDNGSGNRPTGPFNAETGAYEEYTVPGFSQMIEKI